MVCGGHRTRVVGDGDGVRGGRANGGRREGGEGEGEGLELHYAGRV